MAERDAPIGLFDSGVGGLAILAAVRRLLPYEDLLYLADSAHFPYGPKPDEDVIRLAEANTRFLLERGCKLVVVACNTASGSALPHLRATFPVPFVGVEPGVKPATAATRTGHVAVLATEGTVSGRNFARLVSQLADGVTVHAVPAPGLAAAVERGEVTGRRVTGLLERYLAPLRESPVDVLVLGCTHYAFLRRAVAEAAGPGVTVIDTAEPVARQVRRVLEERGLLREPGPPGRVEYHTTGDEQEFRRVMARLRESGTDLPEP